MKIRTLLVAISCSPVIAQAQNPPAVAASATGSMVITGDREAPLVLHIVPWQEPKPVVPPPVALQQLLPEVVDQPRGVLEDPLNRPPVQVKEAAR